MTVETATYVGELDTALPAGTDTKSEGDNHIRLMKAALQATFGTPTGKLARTQSKSSNYTVVAGDILSIIETTAVLTLALTAVATLGHFAFFLVAKAPTTLDPNASELINGETTILCEGVYLVKTNGSAWEAIPLHARSGMKNAIINGDFNVWQRGTSFAAIASGEYSADRWIYSEVGDAVHTISRSTDVPTVAQAGRLFNYSILVDCTTADATVAAGDLALLQQRLEGYCWLPFAQRPLVLSFWVKATKTGTYCVSLVNNGGDRSLIGEYTVNVTDTWEKKTVIFVASPSAGTWNYTTGIGLRLSFALMVGSTYHTTAGAWQTGQFYGTANQVNACDNVANDFRVTGVQLEVGNVATEFEQQTFQQELALCQRYYWKTFGVDVTPAQNAGANTGEHTFGQPAGASAPGVWAPALQLPVTMRAAPSIVGYNPQAANGEIRNISSAADWSSTVIASTPQQITLNGTTPAGTSQATQCGLHLTASAEL